jgi:hypothetical protein
MRRIIEHPCRTRLSLVGAVMLWLLPGTAAAQTEAVEYYATDAIGSIRVVFDASGNVIGRMDYVPFGEELYQGPFLPSQRFAQLTRDGEAGQDHAEARMYQLRTGRFSAAGSRLRRFVPTPAMESLHLCTQQSLGVD